MVDNLAELRRGVSSCVACPLHEGRTNAVPGDGPDDAEVAFIGEAPGFYEDKEARPFVGQAGKFLEELLVSVGWTRDQVYITNVVKCRPPNNRDPLPNELETCESNWLQTELGLVNPRIIVTLGRYSLARLFPRESIGRVHGKTLQWGKYTVYPIYHPAAALHQQRLRGVIMDDFKRLPEVLEQVRSQAHKEHGPAGAPDQLAGAEQSEPQQLNLL